MLNVRDITKIQNMHEAIKSNSILKHVYSSLATDLLSPFESIDSLCQIIQESGGPALQDQRIVHRNCTAIQNSAKTGSYHVKNFLDLNEI